MGSGSVNPAFRRFIVLEGIDGSGTTTQLGRLGNHLAHAGIRHWITCEPTRRPEGSLLRRILSGELDAHPGTVAYLFAADRHQHLHGSGGIVERLESGDVVVCDRYVLSSLAYQSAACGSGLPRMLNSGFPVPGLTLFFRIPPAVSLRRLAGRERLDIYERLEFLETVSAEYERALGEAALAGGRIVIVDAAEPEEIVWNAVRGAVDTHLGPA